MKSFEDAGLRVAAAADAAAFTAWPAGPPDGPHVVRLDVPAGDPAAFADPAVVVRPTWVHWVCPAGEAAAGVIGRQSTGQRQRSRAGLRALGAMTYREHSPIDAESFDEWAALYSVQLDRLRHGRKLALILRRSLLEPDQGHLLLTWRRADGRLACGCVVDVDPAHSTAVVRFSAVAADNGSAELARAMYLVAADVAAARGLRWVTLGRDVDFYGAAVSPGLCTFKLRIGFRPVPADAVVEGDSRPIAERVLTADGLRPPILRFEYRQARDPLATVEDYFDGAHALRLVATGPAETRDGHGVRDGADYGTLPPHRRITTL